MFLSVKPPTWTCLNSLKPSRSSSFCFSKVRFHGLPFFKIHSSAMIHWFTRQMIQNPVLMIRSPCFTNFRLLSPIFPMVFNRFPYAFSHIFVWGSCFDSVSRRSSSASSSSASPSALSHTSLSTTICHTHLFVNHHLSHHHLSHSALSHTSLSTTIFHTTICHAHTPPSFITHLFTHILVTHHLSHIVTHHLSSFTHIFVTHHLSHTSLSHTICHTSSLSTIFVNHHLSHTSLSTTIFPAICHTQLCQPPSFTHIFVTHHLSHTSLSTTIFHTHLLRGGRGTWRHRASAAFCVAGVALGGIHRSFAHPPSFCGAGVALGDIHLRFGDIYLGFAWHAAAWHLWHWAGSGGALGLH